MEKSDLFGRTPDFQCFSAVRPVLSLSLSLADVGGVICLSDVWSRRG